MNSSLGSKFSKPKDNSVFSSFLILPKPQGGFRKYPVLQICFNHRSKFNVFASGELSLSQENSFHQALELEPSNENFFNVYSKENERFSLGTSLCLNSLEKLSKSSFCISNKNLEEFFEKGESDFFFRPLLDSNTTKNNFPKKVIIENRQFPLNKLLNAGGDNFSRENLVASTASIKSVNSSISLATPVIQGFSSDWGKRPATEPLTYNSKNVLAFLFCVFLSDSKFVAFTNGETNIGGTLYSRFAKLFVLAKTGNQGFFNKSFGSQSFVSWLRALTLSSPIGKGSFSQTAFIQKRKGKNQILPFFIFFYLICLGFKGSKEKCLLHEQRISYFEVDTTIEGTKNNAKNSTLPNLNFSQSWQRESGKEQNLSLSVQNYKTNQRFSQYSPIKINTRNLESQNSALPNTITQIFLNKNIEKVLRYSVYISTQCFVFFVIHNLISENNFGRHNPLRQKDSKTNQARILWPKKSHWYNVKTKSKLENTLPGIQDISTLLEVLIDSLKKSRRNSDKFIFVAPPKGYLFVGPPGTGKTLLAQQIAQLAEVPFICVSASEIQKQIEIGTRIGALRLRKLFQQAHTLSPCILFFDEIDAIAKRQSQHDSKLFTEFLIQMDSWGKKPLEGNNLKQKLSQKNNSIILGTTNYLEQLDSAFVRSGRFDRILALNYPSKKIRFDILTFYLKKNNPIEELDCNLLKRKDLGKLVPNTLEKVSLKSSSTVFLGTNLGLNYFSFVTEGFSQAHLAKLVNESLLFTISQNDKVVGKNSFKLLNKKTVLTKHSFRSLLHGLKQMLIHRKNLPYQKLDALN